MKIFRIHIVTVLLLPFILFLSVPAFGAYTIVPMQFTLHARPGETVTHTMKAENTGEGPVSIRVVPQDFIKGPYGEERQVAIGTVERGCAGWIRLSPKKLDLAPRETRTITFSMTIPMDAEGSYWGNILVSQVSKPTLSKTIKKGKTSFQIFALQDMLIRVVENVPGTERKMGTITDMSVKDQEADGRARVEIVFENQGNSLLKSDGKIEIRDENGETVLTIPLEYGHAPFTVYPGGKRIVYARIKEKLQPGDYIILAIIDYGGEDLVAGEMEFEVK